MPDQITLDGWKDLQNIARAVHERGFLGLSEHGQFSTVAAIVAEIMRRLPEDRHQAEMELFMLCDGIAAVAEEEGWL